MKRFYFINVFNSPFKRPKFKWYIGKVAIGTPYFYPRRWVKSKSKPGYKAAVQKKIGFDFVDLGWKTKWDDYRFEWNPLISFVFFKWQIALMIVPEHPHQYWESWLYYHFETVRTDSKEERIKMCIEDAPCTWTSYDGTKRITTNYYKLILKDKYQYLVNE